MKQKWKYSENTNILLALQYLHHTVTRNQVFLVSSVSYCSCKKITTNLWLKTTHLFSYSFGGQECKTSLTELNQMQVSAGLQRFWEEDTFPYPFQFWGAFCIPWLMTPFLHHSNLLIQSSHLLLRTLIFCLPIKGPLWLY